MSRFEELKVGDKAELKHLITQEDINKFVELTGDDNKLHVNVEYAQKTSFKKPVAHGMLGASFISTIIGTKLPGDGALWFAQNIEFLLPVRIGDELTIKAEIIKKVESSQSIDLQTDIYNQHKQKVTTGTAKVKIISQDALISENKSGNNNTPTKNVLVIGGTGGIGSATCLQLAKEGCNIAIHFNSNKDGAQKLLNEISTLDVKSCIVSGKIESLKDAEDILKEASRKIGEISILINCATLKTPGIKFEKLDWSDFESHFNINIKSNFFLAQALIPLMKSKSYGKFVFISSQYTDGTPPDQLSFYVTAKHSLNGFAKSLAVELAPFNIKVNIVSPGMTETDLISDVPERTKLLLAAKAPLRRLAKPVDIANVITFLISDKADYITGETIRVNGGQVML